jgi:hypothetical protein
VAAHLAAEQDVIVAHLSLQVRVAGLPHDGHAAVLPDVVDERLRGLHVEDDLGAGMAGEQITGEQDQDQVGLVTLAALVDDPDAIGVAVVSDPDIGADLENLGLQILDVALVLGVGQMIRKAPVRLAVELGDLAPDPAQSSGP